MTQYLNKVPINMVEGLEESITTFNEHLEHYATTSDLTLYVNANNGNDSNDGKSSTSAFKTIQAAIDSLPDFVNHTTTINISDGTYNEDVLIKKNGVGLLMLQGNETTPTNVKISSVKISETKIYVGLFDVQLTGTTKVTLVSERSAFAQLRNIVITASASTFDGISVNASNLLVEFCEISNRRNAIIANYSGNVSSRTNAGSGNIVGLRVDYATIRKNGVQPSGTTAEIINQGGDIK